jgi:hypothetical protein
LATKGPITWSIFNHGVELSPVARVEISALSVIQNSIKSNVARLYDNFFHPNPGPSSTPASVAGLNFQPRAELGPGLKILSCNRFNPGLKLFMSYSSMRGSYYLLQKNKMEAIMEPFNSISTVGLKLSI